VIGAINRIIAVNGTVDGCVIRVGSGSFVLGTAATQRAQGNGELIITRDPNVARASSIVTFGAAVFAPKLSASSGWLRFQDITVQRTGVSAINGQASIPLTITFDNVTFDNGSFNSTVYNVSHGKWIGSTLQNVLTTGSFAGPGTNEHRMWRGCTATFTNVSVEGWLVIGNNFTGVDGLTYGSRSASGSIIAGNVLLNVGPTAGVFSIGAGADVAGAAFVQNVAEYISATANAQVKASADSATGNTSHIVIHGNSFAGFFNNGRANLFYDDGATARTNKLMSLRGNIHVQLNNKGDVFVTNGARVGNWAYLYGVGCVGEFSQFIDANSGGIGTSFAQAYPGLAANIGTSATVRNDPLFTTYAGTTSGPTAGAGGGTYTLQSGSPAKAMLASPALRFDLAGNTRSATAASAGAYE
jgi:hypothetical protein